MMIRLDFVTNSSSSSFTIRKANLSEKQIQAIWNHSALGEKLNMEHFEWGWEIAEVDGFITGSTSMDNFDMHEFLDIIDVRAKQIIWGSYEPEFPEDAADLIADTTRGRRPTYPRTYHRYTGDLSHAPASLYSPFRYPVSVLPLFLDPAAALASTQLPPS